MDGIADYLHPVVLIQEDGLEHQFTREPVQFSELILRIHTHGKPEVIPLQNITQFLIVFRLEEEQERNLSATDRIDIGNELLPFGQLQFATGTPDGIDIHQHLIFRLRNPVIHRIAQLTGKYRILWETHLLPLPFFHQLRDVLLGRILARGKQ